jgi:hypothetical protein
MRPQRFGKTARRGWSGAISSSFPTFTHRHKWLEATCGRKLAAHSSLGMLESVSSQMRAFSLVINERKAVCSSLHSSPMRATTFANPSRQRSHTVWHSRTTILSLTALAIGGPLFRSFVDRRRERSPHAYEPQETGNAITTFCSGTGPMFCLNCTLTPQRLAQSLQNARGSVSVGK